MRKDVKILKDGDLQEKKGWKVRGREEASPSGKSGCHNHGCFLLMLFPCHHPKQMCVFLLAYSLFLLKLLGWQLKCFAKHDCYSGCAICTGLQSQPLLMTKGLMAITFILPSTERAVVKWMPGLTQKDLTGKHQKWCPGMLWTWTYS